jgi:uncharacterized membrane protein YhaH (DUF805 family)
MFKALFSAKGRMRRRDWWLWRIALVVVYLSSNLLMHRFFGTASFKEDLAFKGPPSDGLQYWVLFLAIFGQWPVICLNAKRWHDRNRPGWLAVVGATLLTVPTLFMHFGDMATGFAPRFAIGAAQAVFGLLGGAYAIWVLIDCGILDGTRGPNRYGPSPKGIGAQPEDVF